MRAAWLLVLLLTACVGPAVHRGDVQALAVPGTRGRGGETLNLLVYLPPGYGRTPERRWPLLVYLPGIFVEGENANFMTRSGFPAMLERGFAPPFVVAIPQQRSFARPYGPRQFGALLDHVEARYRIDPDRVHVTGVSLGATAGWDIVKAYADRVASFVPLVGYGNPAGMERMAHVAVWAFYGRLDAFAPEFLAGRAARAHAALDPSTRITVLPGKAHWIQEAVYGSPALWTWWSGLRRRRSP
jgi:predicted peptidase